ncbi:MAG: MBL fold metallo-hydrolase [Bdellovibrio sp.]|nr:MAG: MBL fold metallo-hydrolase [Bdellovibrio sp.]
MATQIQNQDQNRHQHQNQNPSQSRNHNQVQVQFQVQKKSLKIGEYEICPIPTGRFGLDGGSMFGTVPKVLWERSNPADEKNRITMEARALLLKSSSRKILIDTGNGGDFIPKYGANLGRKFAELYNIDAEGPSLEKSLAKFDVTFNDVTDVILTHLHFDHAGGATSVRGGEMVPTFPKAKYYLQKRNLETASSPNLRERASYFPSNYEPLIKKNVLKLFDGEVENFIPGFSVFISNGHTQGHQMVRVSDGTTTLLYCGDVVPTSSHVRLAWVMGFDLEPLRIIAEKERILSAAADQGWYLYFEHDPYCDAATVSRDGKDYVVSTRYWL